MSEINESVWVGYDTRSWIRQFFYGHDDAKNEALAKAWAAEAVPERRWIQKLQPASETYTVKVHNPDPVYTMTPEARP